MGDFEICALADVSTARRQRALELLPGARAYEDARQLLEVERHRLDFVDIVTPPYVHASLAHAALDHGLHVLCEHPIATSISDARSLLQHARLARRVLFPCETYKHAPVVRAVRRILASSAIGRVRVASLQSFQSHHPKGAPDWKPDWRRERAFAGGGVGMDEGCHALSLAFEWLGAYPRTISARTLTLDRHEGEDNFQAILTFPSGTASLQLSWTGGARNIHYALHGERGSVSVDDDEVKLSLSETRIGDLAPDLQVFVGGARVASHWDGAHAGWFVGLLDEFKRAVYAEDRVGREANDALLCVSVIAAGYESAARRGREVDVAEVTVGPMAPRAPGLRAVASRAVSTVAEPRAGAGEPEDR